MEYNKKEVGIILGVSVLIVIIGIILFLFLTKSKTYTVSFNTNGGEEIKSIKVKQNESIGRLPQAKKEGYNFLYWVIDGTIIKEDYKVKKDITLEARYEIKSENTKIYKITFDTDGGSEIPTQEVKENEKIKYPGEPIKEGYKFKMWVYDGEAIDFSKPIIKDMTLKAEYEKITTSTTTTKKVTTTVKPTTKARVTTTKKVTPTTAKPQVVDTGNCTYDGELVPGVEYVNGDYTYKYKQEPETGGYDMSEGIRYKTLTEDGWWAVSTESLKYIRSVDNDGPTYETSTKPITSKLCKTINGKPIISMQGMFGGSRATVLDLSSFDTSKVTNMYGMFYGSAVASLDLSTFNTSNVKDMSFMFQDSAATSLKLRTFNTSNVTDMSWMFDGSSATMLDLSSFDTSKVTDMFSMFSGSAATSIDLSSFNTSNVSNMSGMFRNSKATTLDLNTFDTSSVTNMRHMFSGSAATTLDLSSFDTSKVTDMGGMFSQCAATTIILTSFNTSKVKDMSWMFENSKATTLDLNTFDTSNVTSMRSMFQNAAATIGYARTQADANKFNQSLHKPDGLTFVVKS